MKIVGTILALVATYWSLRLSAADTDSIQSFKVKDSQKLQKLFQTDKLLGGAGNQLNEQSPIYQEILGELKDTYQQIGQRQADRIANGNRDLNWIGDLNTIGLSYQKSFVNFQIYVRRQLAPDLFDDNRWIVNDEFTIEVDASKLLGNLHEMDAVDINATNFGAYAGVTFRRSYKYIHFANSYQDGLTTKLDKLFLSFLKFRQLEFLSLAPYEILKKEDYLSFNAGGVVSGPIYGNITGSIGAIAEYERLAKLNIQRVGPDDNPKENEEIRISYEKSKGIRAGVSASIQADFLMLLRITLFSFDFSYKLSESNKVYLSLARQDLEKLRGNNPFSKNVMNLIKGRKYDLNVLANNIVSQETRKTEEINSKYSILIWGGTRDQQTQQIDVVSNGILQTFFRHSFEKVSFSENILKRLLNIVAKAFLDWDTIVDKSFKDIKTMRFEYEAVKDLLKEKRDLPIEEKENFTISFGREFFAAKTVNSRHKKSAKTILSDYSSIDPSIFQMIELDIVRGPMTLKTRFQMGKKAIDYFNLLERDDAYNFIASLCKAKPKGIFAWFRSLFGGCKSTLQKRFDKYFTELHLEDVQAGQVESCKKQVRRRSFFMRRRLMQKCLVQKAKRKQSLVGKQIPLWRLKSFLQKLYEKSENKVDMYSFFGIGHFFVFGSIKANTSNGSNFIHHFREGNFQGLGVVDRHLRSGGLRVPASIDIE